MLGRILEKYVKDFDILLGIRIFALQIVRECAAFSNIEPDKTVLIRNAYWDLIA